MRFFLLKICSWRFFLEDLFWRFFHWIFEKVLRRFVHGDFSIIIWFWRFFLEDLFWRLNFWKNFNEDLFMDIFPWRFILRDFSIEVLEIFIEDLFIGEFFLWNMVLEIFPLKNGEFSFWKWRWSQSEEGEDGLEMMKIYSWFFFFFFFEKLIIWMRTLAGSWCGLLDKSLLNFCKKIISINKGFFHWNELEILTQCP